MKNEFNQQVSLISYLLVKMRLLDMRRIRDLISAPFAENISLSLSQKCCIFCDKNLAFDLIPPVFKQLDLQSQIIYTFCDRK